MSRALRLCLAAAAAVLCSRAGWGQISVVDMVPQAQSIEEGQDSEPHLAVDRADPSRLAATAFTPVQPGAGDLAPLYISSDGGLSWDLSSIIPSIAGSDTGTRDITVAFGGTSHLLYLALIRDHSGFPDDVRTQIYRTPDLAAVPALIGERDCAGNSCPDLPWIQATTVLGGPDAWKDRAYVAMNDMTVAPQTASIFQSLDAAVLSPMFDPVVVETRPTVTQDTPAVRVAIHPNGTVYSLFNHWTFWFCNNEQNNHCIFGNAIGDVVVARDDAWGAGGPPPYAKVIDPDGFAGKRVVKDILLPWRDSQFLGLNRLGAGDLSIAVDPRNSDTVYIAYSDTPINENTHNLHLLRSLDGGLTWSPSDLVLVLRGKNPALAINSHGKIAFLYQQVNGFGFNSRWETHFRRSPDGGAWDDVILANVPANSPPAPAVQFQPYLGDYDYLTAVGKHFYGVFSADNDPNPATNFPLGVTFQRLVSPAPAPHLVRLDGVTPVNPSIDPFFIRSIELDPGADFYARDFTQSPSSFDNGLEPSSDPVFYTDSDVWNRQSAAPGGFDANDRPVSELPVDPPASNYAFARISRNASGAAATVTAHFLYADFGLGVPYADLGSVDVPFGAADTQLVSPGLSWDLPAGHSDHLCLATELDAPGDPVIATLAGNAPGWPTTDLMVLNDNNLAQRNMILPAMLKKAARVSYYALLHNAATRRRDMVVRIEASDEVRRRLGEPRIDVIGGAGRVDPADRLVLPDMQPGENRWLRLTLDAPLGDRGDTVPVRFVELSGNSTVNGAVIAPWVAPAGDVIHDLLQLHLMVFRRMAKFFRISGADPRDPGDRLDEASYLEYLRSNLPAMAGSIEEFLRTTEEADPFDLRTALGRLDGELRSTQEDVAAVSAAHDSLLQGLDAFMTRVRKAQGDVADILLHVRWQKDLYSTQPALQRLDSAREVTSESARFISAYEARRQGTADYPRLIERLLPAFRETARALEAEHLDLASDVAAMEASLASPAALQKAHRGYLLKLQLVP